MTYCLALRRNEGVAFMADTRTNARVDHVGIHPEGACSCPGARSGVRHRIGGQPEGSRR